MAPFAQSNTQKPAFALYVVAHAEQNTGGVLLFKFAWQAVHPCGHLVQESSV
jgi:hypothetical protein